MKKNIIVLSLLVLYLSAGSRAHAMLEWGNRSTADVLKEYNRRAQKRNSMVDPTNKAIDRATSEMLQGKIKTFPPNLIKIYQKLEQQDKGLLTFKKILYKRKLLSFRPSMYQLSGNGKPEQLPFQQPARSKRKKSTRKKSTRKRTTKKSGNKNSNEPLPQNNSSKTGKKRKRKEKKLSPRKKRKLSAPKNKLENAYEFESTGFENTMPRIDTPHSEFGKKKHQIRLFL